MKLIYFLLLLALPLTATSQYLQESPVAENQAEVGFKLYPNPAYTDVVYIKTPKKGTKLITVYDVFGKIVLTDQIRSQTLDISKLDAGVYLLKIVIGDATLTRKLIVK